MEQSGSVLPNRGIVLLTCVATSRICGAAGIKNGTFTYPRCGGYPPCLVTILCTPPRSSALLCVTFPRLVFTLQCSSHACMTHTRLTRLPNRRIASTLSCTEYPTPVRVSSFTTHQLSQLDARTTSYTAKNRTVHRSSPILAPRMIVPMPPDLGTRPTPHIHE